MTNTGLDTKIKQTWTITCFAPDGTLKWEDTFDNIVVTEGKNDILDKYYSGSSYTASHAVGLTNGTPTFDAGDTMSTHAGWTEETSYDEASRPTLNMGTASSGSIDNSASKATFTMNASVTIGGAFVSTDATKGGTAGTLVGGDSFTNGDRSVASGDTVNVQITASL